MRLTMKSAARAASLAIAGSVVIAPAAMADPKPVPGQTLDLACGTDTYAVTVAGNGNFTPAHDSASTTVFIPVAFANQVGDVKAADDGEVLASFADDTFTAKNGNRTGQGSTRCGFVGTAGPVFDTEFGEEVYYSFSGDVWVKAKL